MLKYQALYLFKPNKKGLTLRLSDLLSKFATKLQLPPFWELLTGSADI